MEKLIEHGLLSIVMRDSWLKDRTEGCNIEIIEYGLDWNYNQHLIAKIANNIIADIIDIIHTE